MSYLFLLPLHFRTMVSPDRMADISPSPVPNPTVVAAITPTPNSCLVTPSLLLLALLSCALPARPTSAIQHPPCPSCLYSASPCPCCPCYSAPSLLVLPLLLSPPPSALLAPVIQHPPCSSYLCYSAPPLPLLPLLFSTLPARPTSATQPPPLCPSCPCYPAPSLLVLPLLFSTLPAPLASILLVPAPVAPVIQHPPCSSYLCYSAPPLCPSCPCYPAPSLLVLPLLFSTLPAPLASILLVPAPVAPVIQHPPCSSYLCYSAPPPSALLAPVIQHPPCSSYLCYSAPPLPFLPLLFSTLPARPTSAIQHRPCPSCPCYSAPSLLVLPLLLSTAPAILAPVPPHP